MVSTGTLVTLDGDLLLPRLIPLIYGECLLALEGVKVLDFMYGEDFGDQSLLMLLDLDGVQTWGLRDFLVGEMEEEFLDEVIFMVFCFYNLNGEVADV